MPYKKNYLLILFFVFFSYASQASFCSALFGSKSKKNKLTESFNSKIFKGNDIRGVFLKDFNTDFSETLGKALMSFSKKQLSVAQPKILIGYDARVSSPELTKVLSDTLVKQGATVSVVGLVPTPLVYFLLQYYGYTAGVIVTASHNPVEYNGFKIVINNEYKKYNIISDLKKIITRKKFLKDKDTGREVSLDPYTPYINSLKKEFPNLKSIPFVVDAGNGASGLLAKKVFKALGLEPYVMYMEADGTFPNHHPDPTKESNLVDLKKKITESDAFFGVGFDGDGDRLGIITFKQKFIQSDEFAYMFLSSIFSNPKNPKTLIADVKVSNWYFEKAEEMGANVIMSESGYSFLKGYMIENQASLAMELSGHIMFNDRPNRGFDDALYNTLRFIELIGEKRGTIEKLLPKVKTVKTNEIRLSLDAEVIVKALDNLKQYLDKNQENYISIDGLRITRGDAWGLVRSSNTEDVLSLRFEAQTKKQVIKFIKEFSNVMELEIPKEKVLLF